MWDAVVVELLEGPYGLGVETNASKCGVSACGQPFR
jgi:hypothetical protein